MHSRLKNPQKAHFKAVMNLSPLQNVHIVKFNTDYVVCMWRISDICINFLMWHAFHHLECISSRYMDTWLWTQELVCPQAAISSHQLVENCKCAQANAASIWTDIRQRSWAEKYKTRLSSVYRIFYTWHYKKYFSLYGDEHILKRFISSLSEDTGSVLFWGKKDAAKMSQCLGNICSASSWLRKLHPNFICILLMVLCL